MATSLVLFRRDLRLNDNTALNQAFRLGQPVLPVFVIDRQLVDRWQHADKRLAFLYQSVRQLEQAISERGGKLVVMEGAPDESLGSLIPQHNVSDVFLNRDYTPLASGRDQNIAAVCEQRGVSLHCADDLVLNTPSAVKKDDGNPYVVFTPYFRRASALPVAPPEMLSDGVFLDVSGPTLEDSASIAGYLSLSLDRFEPGIAGAAAALERISQLGQYGTLRDIPATEQTSRLSAHLRFGTCSARQVHSAVAETLGRDHPLIRQLYWRDFYMQIAWHYPHVYRGAFRREYDRIEWRYSAEDFERWKAGETGFPIVDAGMRELAQTGFMHNRVRMIVASFLTKNLHIDWRLGEAHFAAQLVDYEPAVNNGNWQWGASTGCDAQPYFRVFNPWRQQEKFDKDCAYIKRWVPELAAYPAKAIHRLEREGDFYLPQIVNLKQSAEEIKLAFKAVSDG